MSGRLSSRHLLHKGNLLHCHGACSHVALGVQAKADNCNCRAVSKESQNRYSKSAKDWGWREFLQLHTLFDQEAGFLVSDSVVFAAEVLVLKEVSEVKQVRH